MFVYDDIHIHMHNTMWVINRKARARTRTHTSRIHIIHIYIYILVRRRRTNYYAVRAKPDIIYTVVVCDYYCVVVGIIITIYYAVNSHTGVRFERVRCVVRTYNRPYVSYVCV